jgi:hypothetical protein
LKALPAETFELEDFRHDLRLGERWIAAQAAPESVVDQFVAVSRLHRLAGSVATQELVNRYWNRRKLRPDELAVIAQALPAEELESPPLAGFLAEALRSDLILGADLDSWVVIAVAVARWPADLLRSHGVEFAVVVSECAGRVSDAVEANLSREPALRHLSAEYQRVIYGYVPPIVGWYVELEAYDLFIYRKANPQLLEILSAALRRAVIQMAMREIGTNPHDLPLAACLFVMRNYLSLSVHHPDSRMLGVQIADRLDSIMPKWDRRELATIDQLAQDLDPSSGPGFASWVKSARRQRSLFRAFDQPREQPQRVRRDGKWSKRGRRIGRFFRFLARFFELDSYFWRSHDERSAGRKTRRRRRRR